jgi:hypothetical protein
MAPDDGGNGTRVASPRDVTLKGLRIAEQQRRARQGVRSKLQEPLGLVGAKAVPPPDLGQLGDLAEHRSRRTKAYLTDQASIDPQRLYGCRGHVDSPPAKGCPRVDLLLQGVRTVPPARWPGGCRT